MDEKKKKKKAEVLPVLIFLHSRCGLCKKVNVTISASILLPGIFFSALSRRNVMRCKRKLLS